MNTNRNHFDISGSIDTTDSVAVHAKVRRIYLDLYPEAPTRHIDQAFRDAAALYLGAFPGFHGCDTAYHDIQHVLNVTLATARLMHGYERARKRAEPLEAPLFRLGVVIALFHDCGYVRRRDDTEHRNGGELTLTHVSRGASFLCSYLPQIGMGDLVAIAAALIHYTGFEIPVEQIKLPSLRLELLGRLLGSADIIAQMSDRCYLEKCRDRLFPEFVAGGIARKRLPGGEEQVIFESGDDLVMKTPQFFQTAMHRLEHELDGGYRYARNHFGGQDLYLEEMSKNVRFAQAIGLKRDTAALKRVLPETLGRA